MSVRGEDGGEVFLGTAIVITALMFGFTAGFQAEHAISGEQVELAVLVATGGGFLTTLVVYIGRKE